MRRLPVLAFGLVLGSVGGEPVALANGRFPRAQRLLEEDGDPQRLLLGATYGLLSTQDGGGEWRHVCELGFAFTIDEIDPLPEFAPDGSMLVKGSRSLNRSVAPFCAFEPVLGSVGTDTVVDYSLDRADRNRVFALFQTRGSDGRTVHRLEASDDGGRSFATRGTPLPADLLEFAVTLDLAPSDSLRIYASATGVERPVLARSDDGGESWTTSDLPLESDETPYLAAVHPTDADALYVRSDTWVESGEGMLAANDALLYSDDGGGSFREVYRAPAKLFGFALSPDGSELLVGYGDPVMPSRSVEPGATGIYRASTSDHVFTKIFAGPVSCLAWTENGVYACTSQAERGFALGVAPSADFDLEVADPFVPLLDLAEVEGPLDCPSESSGAVCQAAWSDNCAIFGNCASGAAGADGAGGASENPASGSSSCGCRFTATSDGRAWLWLAAALLARRASRRAQLRCPR